MSPDSNPQENSPLNRKKWFLVASTVSLILIFIILVTVVASLQPKKTAQISQTTPVTQVPLQPSPTTILPIKNIPARELPKVTFDNWTNKVTQASAVSQARILTIKQPNALQGKVFAQKLGLNTIEEDGTSLTATLENSSGSSFFMYETNTGSLLYIAENGPKLSSAASPASVVSFLKNFGVYDQSMKVLATYKKTTTPGVTYYELQLPMVQLQKLPM